MKSNSTSAKSIFTRKCIGDAIVKLMHQQNFSRITVSEVAATAGISRMTFYHYYNSLYQALENYLELMVQDYRDAEKNESTQSAAHFSYEHILFSLVFFDKYADFFLTLAQQNLYSILLEGVNGYLQETIGGNTYQLYFYAGGLLNVFLAWEQSGKAHNTEELAADIYRFCRSTFSPQDESC